MREDNVYDEAEQERLLTIGIIVYVTLKQLFTLIKHCYILHNIYDANHDTCIYSDACVNYEALVQQLIIVNPVLD